MMKVKTSGSNNPERKNNHFFGLKTTFSPSFSFLMMNNFGKLNFLDAAFFWCFGVSEKQLCKKEKE